MKKQGQTWYKESMVPHLLLESLSTSSSLGIYTKHLFSHNDQVTDIEFRLQPKRKKTILEIINTPAYELIKQLVK